MPIIDAKMCFVFLTCKCLPSCVPEERSASALY